MPEEWGLKCNMLQDEKCAPMGALCWVTLLNPGNVGDRLCLLIRSRGGRWVKKWHPRKRLTGFRSAWVPENIRDRAGLFETREEADAVVAMYGEAVTCKEPPSETYSPAREDEQ